MALASLTRLYDMTEKMTFTVYIMGALGSLAILYNILNTVPKKKPCTPNTTTSIIPIPIPTADELAERFSPQIFGKTVLITGVSPNGLGGHFALTIAKHRPKLLILAARDISKAEETQQAISSGFPCVKTRVLQLDLASQGQVRSAAEVVNAYEEPIDVLMNNAGVMACDYSSTEKDSKFENQFGTNHIGHFLFTNLIMPRILAAGPGARVVNVSSSLHMISPIQFDDLGFSGGETYDKWIAYGQSKTANLLFTVSLAEKLSHKGILAFSLHPGVISGTGLQRTVSGADFESLQALANKQGEENLMEYTELSISQGTATHIAAAFDPSIADHNGGYLVLCDAQLAPGNAKTYASDKGNAERLWKLGEEIVGECFPG